MTNNFKTLNFAHKTSVRIIKILVSLLLIVGHSCFLFGQNNDLQIIPGNPVCIKPLPVRKVRTELGITQQPNEKLNWMIEARFGMFIHWGLSLIHISEPTRLGMISYAVFCLK